MTREYRAIDPFLLPRDARGIADYASAGRRRYDGERGSEKLLRALLRIAPKPALPKLRKRPSRARTNRGRMRSTISARTVARERVFEIQVIAAELFNIQVADLRRARGAGRLPQRRQLVMQLCRELTGASYQDIGKHFGGRDHTTVMHACHAVAERLAYDAELKYDNAELRARLSGITA